jgi:hypothetical protein
MRSIRHVLIGTTLVVATAAPAAAQQTAAPQAPWWPWIGCWQVTEESVDDGAQLLAQLGGAQPSRTNTAPGTLVCVAPSGDNGVTVTTTVNDRPVLTETIVADGTERPLSEEGCRGWQKAEWSALGARVYARAEITCGDQPRRTVSGLAAMVAGPMWLDIQMIESEGRKSLRVRRYRRAANQPQATALPSTMRGASAAPLGRTLTLADIKEAAAKVPAEALQAAVLELGNGGYDLKAKQLLELDAAGVPDSVTDLMVAMSFPKRFIVERASSGGGGFSDAYGAGMWDPASDMWSYFAMWPYMGMWPAYRDPFYYSAFYSPYYSPFGYGRWGYYYTDYYRYYGGGIVIIDPTVPGTGVTETVEGRVVDGRGYTRIRRNEPPPPTRINTGDGGGWGTTSSGSGSSGSSGSGSSGVSSGGYSSGGSGGGGRVAIPRPPGL